VIDQLSFVSFLSWQVHVKTYFFIILYKAKCWMSGKATILRTWHRESSFLWNWAPRTGKIIKNMEKVSTRW